MLDALLAKRCPKAMAQLARTETPLEEVTGPWFHSLFCTSLPAETAARVWDVLLLEGHKILFRVGLALFKVRVFKNISPINLQKCQSSLGQRSKPFAWFLNWRSGDILSSHGILRYMHWTLSHQLDLLIMNASKGRVGRTCLSVMHSTSRHQLDLLNIEASGGSDLKTGLALLLLGVGVLLRCVEDTRSPAVFMCLYNWRLSKNIVFVDERAGAAEHQAERPGGPLPQVAHRPMLRRRRPAQGTSS